MASVDQITEKLSAAQIAENVQKAEEQKKAGNAALQEKNLKKAIECYTNAINLNKNNHVYYSNRSAAYLLNNSAKHSIADAQKCIEINADWAKGYSRLGAALHFAGRYQEAYDAYSQGLEKDPQNQTLLDGLTHADTALGRGEGPMVTADITVPGSKDAASGKGHVIGIDLGTTFSCVAVWEGEEGVKIIPDSEGNLTTPSIVGFSEDGQREIGHNAKRMAASNVKNTVYDVKRVLGSLMTEEKVLKDVKTFPYKVKVGAGDKPVISVQQNGQEKDFHPEEISAMVLSKMKKIAEEHLGEEVHRAVITVPAYFNDAQRQATKDAGLIAGLEVMRIINEPTAAALAYGLDMKGDYTKHEQRNILVFDLGGGTFDVSLLSIDGGIFEVKATAGDTHLGGEDFDEALLNHLADAFNAANSGKDIRGNLKSMKRLRQAAEKAKILLSTNDSAPVVLEALLEGIDFSTKVSKEEFEKLNQVLFNRCMETVKKVLADAKMGTADIEDIVLVGGSTRIPKLQEMLSGHFGGKDLCKSINPDEAVAYGAAVQGAILSGMRPAATQQLLLVDVTALSLGIELEGKVFSTVIPRNTKVPCNRRKTYTTTEDYQNAVDVVIFEGERQCTDGNNLLGEFKITNIERAKRGEPKVEVSFNLDTNGILNVTAKDLVTQSVAQVTLNNNRSRLTPEQIEKMLKDAEEHKEEDRRRVENIEARNELEGALYNVIDAAKQANQLETVLKAEEVRSWLENGVGKTTKEIRDKIAQVSKLM